MVCQCSLSATLHKQLIRLRDAELIAVQFMQGDRCSKLLAPTEKGLEYASQFGSQLTRINLKPSGLPD